MFDQTPNQNPAMPMGGYNYNGYQQPVPKVMNNLSQEEIKTLMAQTSQFSLGLTERESLQAACSHRTIDGTSDSLVYDPETGKARCTICGYEFRPIEEGASYETIKEASDRIIDILQTIKIMYTDLPSNAAREYFQIIPLIAKIPQLFEFAAKDFNKHEYNRWNYNNGNMGGMAMLQNLSNMFGASMGMPQQPMYGQPMYQQPAYQQPMGGVPQQPVPGANPFGYPGASQPQQGVPYQPNMAGFQYQPGQVPPTPATPTVPTAAPAPAAATEAAAPAATETVTQKVTV